MSYIDKVALLLRAKCLGIIIGLTKDGCYRFLKSLLGQCDCKARPTNAKEEIGSTNHIFSQDFRAIAKMGKGESGSSYQWQMRMGG